MADTSDDPRYRRLVWVVRASLVPTVAVLAVLAFTDPGFDTRLVVTMAYVAAC